MADETEVANEPSPESEQVELKVNPKIRVIKVNDVIPAQERTTIAWNEHALGDHLDKFLLSEDNTQRTFVFSAPFGGPHLYCYAPSLLLRRNYWTIVTMGLSGTKMNVPEGISNPNDYARAELICYLPPDWSFPPALGEGLNEQNWPLEMLRSYVQYVSSTKAWIARYHGLPNILSDPPGQQFVPCVPFSHVVLFDTEVNEKPGFAVADVDGEKVNFYLVVPVTAAEAAWKREVGIEDSLFYAVGSKEESESVCIDYVIDPNRKCAVTYHHLPEEIEFHRAQQGSEDEDDSEDEGEGSEDEGEGTEVEDGNSQLN
eukprot:gene8907-9644_t